MKTTVIIYLFILFPLATNAQRLEGKDLLALFTSSNYSFAEEILLSKKFSFAEKVESVYDNYIFVSDTSYWSNNDKATSLNIAQILKDRDSNKINFSYGTISEEQHLTIMTSLFKEGYKIEDTFEGSIGLEMPESLVAKCVNPKGETIYAEVYSTLRNNIKNIRYRFYTDN